MIDIAAQLKAGNTIRPSGMVTPLTMDGRDFPIGFSKGKGSLMGKSKRFSLGFPGGRMARKKHGRLLTMELTSCIVMEDVIKASSMPNQTVVQVLVRLVSPSRSSEIAVG